jgi:RNA polymerase sigma-70 factor (ECF subfamily)
VTEWRENPEEQYRREEMERLLGSALGGLHPSYRSVLVLRDMQHLSTQETAELLGISVANVKTRLLRARLQLRDRLAQHFKVGRRSS